MVVNPGGYIGESTRREIAYAHATGTPVSFTDSGEPLGVVGRPAVDSPAVDSHELGLPGRAVSAMMRAMEPRFWLDVTVEVSDEQAVIDAAKAQMCLRFGIDDDYWETVVLPAIAQYGLGQAFSILLLADEITGFLEASLEQSVAGLQVRALSVDTI